MNDFSEKKIIIDQWIYESMRDSIAAMACEIEQLKQASEIIGKKDAWIAVLQDVISEHEAIQEKMKIWIDINFGVGTYYAFLQDMGKIKRGVPDDF